MRRAISGGAGFLGLHLARRLLADGHGVRTLDVVPLDDAGLEASVEELRGDVRDPGDARRLTEGADVLVPAAAALPIQASRDSIRSVNVEGTATTLAAALEAGVGRVILISSTAVYGVPRIHPIAEDAPLVGVGHYGESKIDAEHVAQDFGRRGLDVVTLRPKTFLGPERLGVFEILFDWIREGRRIPILGNGSNRYQLPGVEALPAATSPARAAACVRFPRAPPRWLCARSSCSASHRSPSGTTAQLTATPTWTSPRRSACSASRQACPTRRRSAEPTTGTDRKR